MRTDSEDNPLKESESPTQFRLRCRTPRTENPCLPFVLSNGKSAAADRIEESNCDGGPHSVLDIKQLLDSLSKDRPSDWKKPCHAAGSVAGVQLSCYVE